MGLPNSARSCALAAAAAAVVALTLVFCAHGGAPFGGAPDVVAAALRDAAAAAAAVDAARARAPEKSQHESCAACVARRCVSSSSPSAEKSALDWLRPADARGVEKAGGARPHPHAGSHAGSHAGNHAHNPSGHRAGARLTAAMAEPPIDDDIVLLGVATDSAAPNGSEPLGAGRPHHAAGAHLHAGAHAHAHQAGAHPAHPGAHAGHAAAHAPAAHAPAAHAPAADAPAGDTCAASFDSPEAGGAEHHYCQCKCCRAPCGHSRFCATHAPTTPPVDGEADGADAADAAAGAARAGRPVGNPCAGLAGVLTQAYKLVDVRALPGSSPAASGTACVQTCLPIAAKNTAARVGLTLGQGWCGDVGYSKFEREATVPAVAVGQPAVAAFVYTAGGAVAPAATTLPLSLLRPAAPVALAPAAPAAPVAPVALAPAAPAAQPASDSAEVSSIFAPPPSPSAASPCAPFDSAEPSRRVLLDATKVRGALCTQVCLPAKLEATGRARGVVGGRGTCLAQGFGALVSSGANGNVPWFIYTTADAAAAGQN